MTLDLAIRGGTVVTAADTMRCDVGIRDGRIVALGEDVGPSARSIDAAGLLVLPGGIDSHVHLDQFQGEGIVMADGFRSGTVSAAAGGNTCVIPFALQRRGESLRAAVEAYHAKAQGEALVDYAFADIALWDPERRVTLTQGLMHHGSDYTPYEGLEVTGWPATTLVRGRVVFDGGRVTAEPGHGQFLPRGASGGS